MSLPTSPTPNKPLAERNFGNPWGLSPPVRAYIWLYVLCTWHIRGLYVPVFRRLSEKGRIRTCVVRGLYVPESCDSEVLYVDCAWVVRTASGTNGERIFQESVIRAVGGPKGFERGSGFSWKYSQRSSVSTSLMFQLP